MRLVLPYGDGKVEADLAQTLGPHFRSLGILDVADSAEGPSEIALGLSPATFSKFRAGDSVVVVVSDSFRRTGIERILPHLLDRLTERGVRPSDISFLVSTGTHRGPTPSEAEQILGAETYAAYRDRFFVHDAFNGSQHATLGTTSRGTPVTLNRRYLEADRRIVTGTVVLHYFAGFGGGGKSILPGLASAEAIARNHALNLDPLADRLDPAVRIGALDGNPVAEDIAEAAAMAPPDLLINTVLRRDGQIARLFVGELEVTHRDACALASSVFAVPIHERADLVIASAGNTKNYLQSHKTLYNAHQAMKPGGRIVLLAAAPEGLGGNNLAEWLRLGEYSAIMAGLREHAEINGQTALSTREKACHAVMVTTLSETDTALLGARKAASLDDALRLCRKHFDESGIPNPTYYTMPHASHTVPLLQLPSHKP
jgi:nickel-dependent lactate racemase